MSTTPVLHQAAPPARDEAWWAETERTAQRLADISWIPEVYRKKPNDIMAAALGLDAVGKPLTPMTLKLVYVVNGTVDFMVDLITALVHEHGHEMWVVESDDDHATVAGQRRGSQRVHTRTFTRAQAEAAGLVNKDVWKKYGPDMLVARAAKRVAKRICPEAMLGMPPPLHFAYTDSGRIQVAEIVPDQVDKDDPEVLDAELVEQGEDPGPIPPAPAANEPERGRDNGGAADRGAPAAPVPSGPVDWRELAKAHGVTVGGLLIRARTFAERRGLPAPAAIEDVTDEQVVADVMNSLGASE